MKNATEVDGGGEEVQVSAYDDRNSYGVAQAWHFPRTDTQITIKANGVTVEEGCNVMEWGNFKAMAEDGRCITIYIF